jgi:hypothetical protein
MWNRRINRNTLLRIGIVQFGDCQEIRTDHLQAVSKCGIVAPFHRSLRCNVSFSVVFSTIRHFRWKPASALIMTEFPVSRLGVHGLKLKLRRFGPPSETALGEGRTVSQAPSPYAVKSYVRYLSDGIAE